MSRRAAVISLLVLISMTVALPLVSSLAHRNPSAALHRHHRHSRAWWRRHHALVRRRHMAALKHRREELAASREQHALTAVSVDEKLSAAQLPPALGGVVMNPHGLALTLPEGWSNNSPSLSQDEMKFRLSAPDGRPAGEAALAAVAPAVESAGSVVNPQPMRGQRRTIAGVPFAELRRIVIDKMVATGGWVINDVEREIGGRRVFVVFAQTGASGDNRTPSQSWAFYFAEVNGHVYSFTVHAPLEYSGRMAAESEKVMASLRSAGGRRPSGTETAPR